MLRLMSREQGFVRLRRARDGAEMNGAPMTRYAIELNYSVQRSGSVCAQPTLV